MLPLAGGVSVDVAPATDEAASFALAGRAGVFAGATDVAYAPPGTTLRLRAPADLAAADAVRVAVCLARATGGTGIPARHLPAAEVPVELRGAGIASRQVRNFGVPGVLDAHRIIACEVVTPAGNWSSWPPHKHDTDRPGVEAELEEIYWFETRSTDPPRHGCRGVPAGLRHRRAADRRPRRGAHRRRRPRAPRLARPGRGRSRRRPRTTSTSWPAPAPSGPGCICDDPAHAWVRDTWPDQDRRPPPLAPDLLTTT